MSTTIPAAVTVDLADTERSALDYGVRLVRTFDDWGSAGVEVGTSPAINWLTARLTSAEVQGWLNGTRPGRRADRRVAAVA